MTKHRMTRRRFLRLIAALFMVLVAALVSRGLATEPTDVGNVGKFDFDQPPNAVSPVWNLDNLEYPADAITIESIEERNNGLRIGRADGTQAGRYTITLRASTHDWNPSEVGSTNSVSVRLAAKYSGSAFVSVSISGAGTLLDLGGGKCVLWQHMGERDERVDETALVLEKLPGWRADKLHTYRLEWTPTGKTHEMPFRLLIDGRLIKEFRGHDRPASLDPTFEISFENGVGTALLDAVEWHINGGRPKPALRLAVERGVRQLFLDDYGIQSISGLKRVVNQPQRHSDNPVLQGEHPWEKSSTSVYGTMLYDAATKKFRLWYLCSPEPPKAGRKWLEVGGYRRVTHPTLLAYAESDDAIHWSKPELGQVSFEGSAKNNLIRIGIDNPEGVGVLHDPGEANPARRYKAFFWDRRLAPPNDATGVDGDLAKVPVDPPELTDAQRAGGMWVAFSPDGLRWTTHGPVLPQGSDTTHTILFDPRSKKYLGFGRMGFGRTVALTESDDALHWSEPRLVLACDTNDGPGGQIYGMPTDLYEGLFLGMFWMYREGTDAKIDTQLAFSRDGRRWRRVADRQTFLANAEEGSWDDGMSRVGRGINVVGDTIYLHYSMVNGPHRSPKFPLVTRKFPGAIGLVTLRRDGFVSLDAGPAVGTLVTKSFVPPSGTLHLNVDATSGDVGVEVISSKGQVVAKSQHVTGDHRRIKLTGIADLEKQADQAPLQLRITLLHAKLFSYWFE